MRPDFIISEKLTAAGTVYIVLPTHVAALNWMFAHVTKDERRNMSAHLSHDRCQQLIADAAIEGMAFTQPSSPQPAGGGK